MENGKKKSVFELPVKVHIQLTKLLYKNFCNTSIVLWNFYKKKQKWGNVYRKVKISNKQKNDVIAFAKRKRR